MRTLPTMKTLRALLLLTPLLIQHAAAGLCFRPADQSKAAPPAGELAIK